MSEVSLPFDTSAFPTEAVWSTYHKYLIPDGVLRAVDNELEGFGDSTGMQVKVRTGQAFVQGVYYANDAVKTIAVTAADPSNPRIDRIVLRLDWSANTVTAAVLAGTPAGSPSAPALTQTSSTWEIPIAQVAVAAGATGIAAANVTDDRQWTSMYDELLIPFAKADILAVETGKGFMKMPWPGLILGVWPYASTAPTGASLIIDVNKNAVTIYTTQANRPTITAGNFTITTESTNMEVKTFVKGDRLSVDIDQVGSTVAGADLVVNVRVIRTG